MYLCTHANLYGHVYSCGYAHILTQKYTSQNMILHIFMSNRIFGKRKDGSQERLMSASAKGRHERGSAVLDNAHEQCSRI
jgi:hypothetical protein